MTDSSRIFIDTAPFVYYIEGNAVYFDAVRSLFDEIAECELFTSAITVGEYLTVPYRENRAEYVRAFYTLLEEMDIDTISVDREMADFAAKIRGKYGFRMMDAIQLSVAVSMDCDVFVTNDRQLRQFSELEVRMIA